MPKIIKKILTEDDLLKFCQEQKFAKFSSKDTGYRLALKVPTTFSVEDTVDDNHRGMMKIKIKVFHTGLNRNQSYVSKESAEKAMNTIADRPLLAAIHQLDDGTWDFEGHEMELITNDDGTTDIKYIESQVGSFSSEPAFWEHDDNTGKDYVCAYAYLSEEYTKACDILRSKNGSKNSCELFIDELSYNAKDNYLELNDFYVNASTLLGCHNDGTEIEEGMEGSRADIESFSVENNSVKFNQDTKLIELLESLNKELSNFNKNQKSKEGGKPTNMFEELLKQYNKTVEDITFEYENMSDDELTAKFAELFDEESDGDSEPQAPSNDNQTDDTANTEDTDPAPSEPSQPSTTPESPTDPAEDEDKNTDEDDFPPKKVENSLQRTFEISHDDVKFALYELLAPYEGENDDWYYISDVYDTYFVYHGRSSIYGQKYTKTDDSISFEGERYELFAEYLTESEKTALNDMRQNYTALKEYKENVEKNELHSKKEAIVESEQYSVLSEKDKDGKYVNADFSALIEDMDKYSLEEFETKVKVMHSDYVSTHSKFTSNQNTKDSNVKLFGNANKNHKPKKRYGNLFDL